MDIRSVLGDMFVLGGVDGANNKVGHVGGKIQTMCSTCRMGKVRQRLLFQDFQHKASCIGTRLLTRTSWLSDVLHSTRPLRGCAWPTNLSEMKMPCQARWNDTIMILGLHCVGLIHVYS